MGRQRTTLPPADLTALRKRIDAWRRIKRGGEAMPEPLWQEATALARLHGITPTSRALNLHYGEIKRRALAEPAPPNADAKPELPILHPIASPFVDITAAFFPTKTSTPISTVLELNAHGHTLKLTCGESPALDLGAVIRAFLAVAP